MLTCLPQGICSSNFRVPEAGNAEVTFTSFGRGGAIRLGAMEYLVSEEGLLKPTWHLSLNGQSVATLRRPTVFKNVHELESSNGILQIVRPDRLQQRYEFRRGEAVVGTIVKVHPFTRRTIIECQPDVPVVDQLFAFWLLAILWRESSGGE